MAKKENGTITGYISDTNDYQIKFTDGRTYHELETLVKELQKSSLIEDATLSFVAPLDTGSVNYKEDPWLDSNNPEDTSGKNWDDTNPDGKNWWAEAIHMPSVWNMDLDLKPVKVGIIDSMFDTANEDLDEGKFVKLWNNPSDKKGTCNVSKLYKSATDKNKKSIISHGTHVAGIIAAQAGNGSGITGISQNAELYGFAVLSETALKSPDYIWGDIFMYKVAFSNLLNEGVKVINLSMGHDTALTGTQNGNTNWTKYTTTNSKILESFLLKYVNKNKEFLLIKSAGNDGTESLKYDAKYDLFGQITDEKLKEHIMIVGAAKNADSKYEIAFFSNIGDAVSVYAPGVDILSDIPSKNKAELKDGTSMATPIVSGIASLIWGINPDLTSDQVKQIIIHSTKTNIFDLITGSEQNSNFEAWSKRFSQFNFSGNTGTDSEGKALNNRTTIVDAKLCINMAQSTVAMDQKKELHFGTVNGMIYSLNNENSNNNDFDVSSLSLYNEKGEFIKTIEVLDNYEYYINENTNESSSFNYHTYTELLEPGNYTITAEAEGYQPLSQNISIKENEVTTLNFELEPKQPDIFSQLPSNFIFASGAGGWSTELTIKNDGSFTGYYSDSNMGETGVGYENGTTYICNFSGKFTTPKQMNDYTYSMRLENLQTEGTPGEIYYENRQKFIYSDPYGFDNADEFLIYTPGAPMNELPEGFKNWLYVLINPDEETTLPCYGIYNVGGEEGFVEFDNTGKNTQGKTDSSEKNTENNEESDQPDTSSNNEKMLSTEQLTSIKNSLNVPADLKVTVEQSESTYWDAGECWVTYVTFSYNGKTVAAASVNSDTAELLKDILVYTP